MRSRAAIASTVTATRACYSRSDSSIVAVGKRQNRRGDVAIGEVAIEFEARTGLVRPGDPPGREDRSALEDYVAIVRQAIVAHDQRALGRNVANPDCARALGRINRAAH